MKRMLMITGWCIAFCWESMSGQPVGAGARVLSTQLLRSEQGQKSHGTRSLLNALVIFLGTHSYPFGNWGVNSNVGR